MFVCNNYILLPAGSDSVTEHLQKKKKKVSRSEGIGTELFHIGNMLQNCLSTIAGVHSCKKP